MEKVTLLRISCDRALKVALQLMCLGHSHCCKRPVDNQQLAYDFFSSFIHM